MSFVVPLKTQNAVVVPVNVARYFDKVCKKSLIFDSESESNLPTFLLSELKVGNLLGRGGFCRVSEISQISLSNASADDKNKESRVHMAKNFLRDGEARYAIKILRKDLDKEDTLKAIFDLALEAKFLAVIDHPHIIKIRALAVTTAEHGYLDAGFFLILDRLYNTLDKQLEIWDEKKRKLNNNFNRLLDMKGKKKKELLTKKLNVAYDIAAAVRHLHEKSIIYRDLSTDNIGFDVRGEVKIFDFGLAKELLPALKQPDGTYKLTGYTGSLRYMAPEVVLMKSYNESADVFSFGILLWQIVSCQVPYDRFTIPMYEKLVAHEGFRPTINKKWPKELSDLMESCWSQNPKERPHLEHVKGSIKMFVLEQATGKQIEFDIDLSMKSKHGKDEKGF